ncbi:glycosyltransferase family 1 protein [Lentzea tibetensis]|uniref:Glycosyltransferase family 1 protein n=1 Tax=Lentzea tibetensis TaxID=2591470 RepID=A0A563EKH0_9PSEU|nr:glycosyltransferase [Lentzea tibetensis]TWP47560.1 glycosyltransferase family 1 protein [Lentzea tibetensis]
MRVLFTALPIRSHVVPALVPAALALQRAGHRVVLATGPAVADEVSRLGLPVLVLPDVPSPGDMSAMGWRPEVTGQLPLPLFVGAFTGGFADALLHVARAWQPDLIVRENNEYGGQLVAEALGVPHGVLDIAPLLTPLIPDLAAQLDVLRSGAASAPVFTAGLLPERWYPPELRTPAHHYFRVGVPPAGGSDVPLVLASFGSNVHAMLATSSRLLHITVEALGSLPVRAVVVVGDVASWDGPRPSTVELVATVPQQELLGACSVFVTHAGYSGVRESLSAGVPVVAVPLFADQPPNADRVAELGLGVQVEVAGLTAEALAAAVSRVLAGKSFRCAATDFRQDVLDLPPLSALAEVI